jgi:putative PIN family toxin of toxin-antitoxin system
MPPSIVLDTNVLIAGLRSAEGASFQLLERVGTGAFEYSLSVPLVLEYESVAKRFARELGLTFDDIDDIIDYLCREGQQREIFYLWRPFLPDPQDDMVLELAVEASAEFIVTHNLKDFRGIEQFGIQAIGPGAFLRKHILKVTP